MTIRDTIRILAASAVLAAPLAAQDGDAVFSDTIDVEVVNVEVVVSDKDGQPVKGLTREDFRVFEDGQPVELTNFYAVEQPLVAVGEREVSGEAEADPERPAGGTRDLSLVIFVDNLNIRPENRKLLFENLRSRLAESAVAGTRTMVAAMNNRVEVVQPFTRDLDQVFAALDAMEKETSIHALLDGERRMFLSQLTRASLRDGQCGRNRPPSSSSSGGGSGGGGTVGDPLFDEAIRTARDLALNVRSLGEQRYQAARGTIASLAAFSDTLGGLPGRKALLYLSDGIPVRPADSMAEAWAGKYDQWLQQNESAIRNCSRYPEAVADLQRAVTAAGSSEFDLHSDFDRLTARASDNRLAIYPVSNSGRQSSMVSASIGGGVDGGSGQAMRGAMVTESMSRDASVLQLAEDTGGQALTGNANVGELLERVADDFSTFYSLGYAPPAGKGRGEDDESFRKIEVKVARDGASVRHVKGYHARSWRDRLGDMTAAAALFELESNPLGIQLHKGEPQRLGGRFKVPIMVQIPLGNLQMVSDGENYNANLSLLVVVLDDKGGFSQPRRFDLPIKIPNAQILQARQQAAGYPVELEMKKDARRVAVGVRDHLGQTASCLKLDFDFGGGGDKKSKKSKKSKKG